jgi:epoxyqueuosine reductase
LKNEIDLFKYKETLNNFQKWIVNQLYGFKLLDAGFIIKSIILIAVPHSFYADAEFNHLGKKYVFSCLVMSDFDNTRENLMVILQGNYQLADAGDIPLKRLAVQSGLVVYGRNNICSIDGMGSNFLFMAFYLDMPFDNEYWSDVALALECPKCKACLKTTPQKRFEQIVF